jgi:hypothetical protein
VANRVDATVHQLQPSCPEASLDRPTSHPQLKELPPRHHPVLASGQLRHRAIRMSSAAFAPKAVVDAALAGHAIEVAR